MKPSIGLNHLLQPGGNHPQLDLHSYVHGYNDNMAVGQNTYPRLVAWTHRRTKTCGPYPGGFMLTNIPKMGGFRLVSHKQTPTRGPQKEDTPISPIWSGRKSQVLVLGFHLAMGQNHVPPVSIPIKKVLTWVVNSPTNPKWDPIGVDPWYH